ncbi:Outer membrane lipoprotein-sorting protein [Sphingomonas laterariae]|uniref:Outer membrane lipoprotein-sorting protein n=2 Tax=Edaphosphingomonas laterariae TaxID=861865 RepID=A0A239K853_9SPHN|nr:outer membrane lipoprotein carrier protein LolA [Sphingomonas laterariae]SNT13344.1 Outer membrane lipoprotein-sorting protein [Sphingomonas laterariae]
MIRPFLFALAAAPLATAALIGANPLAAPAVAQATDPLGQVSAHLKSVNTMTASFAQTDRNGKTLTGTLTLKRPGRIRFQYQKGVPLLVVGDGKALTMIDYQVKQVSRWPIGDSPLSVLLNPSKDLSRFAKVVPSGDPKLLTVQARDPKRPEFGTITIVFSRSAAAPAGLMLRGWTVIDAQNNRSTIQLSNQAFNVAVSDKAFQWNDPRPRGPRG